MENLCSIYRFLVFIVFYHQFHTFRGLLSGQASLGSLEWNLWQKERAPLSRDFPIFFLQMGNAHYHQPLVDTTQVNSAFPAL